MPLNSGQVLECPGHLLAGDVMRLHAGDVPAIEQNAAVLRRIEPGDRVAQGGLSAAIGADQAEELASLDAEVNTGDCSEATEPALEPPALEHRRRCRRRCDGRWSRRGLLTRRSLPHARRAIFRRTR